MANSRQISIRWKLTALVAAVVVLTAGTLSVASYVFARDTLRQQIHDRLSVVTSDRQKMLLNYVRQQEAQAGLVASRTRLRQLLEGERAGTIALPAFAEEMRRILLDVRRGNPGMLVIWVCDPAGKVLMATGEGYMGLDFAKSPEFRTALAGEAHVGDIKRHDGGAYQALQAAPTRDENGRTLGVVMMLVDAAPIVEALSDPTGLGATGEVLVGRRDGEMIRYLLPSRTGQIVPARRARDVMAMTEAIAGQSGFQHTLDYRGQMVLAAYRPVGHAGWGLVGKMDEEEAYAPIRVLRRSFITLELIIFLGGLLASYALARRFTRPILRLVQMADAMAAGKPGARVAVEANDEVGLLAMSFNRMVEDVAHSYAILENRVRERTVELQRINQTLQEERYLLQRLMDNIPDHIYFKDAQSRFLRVNQACAKWMGFANSDALAGKTDFDVFTRKHAQEAFDDEQRIIRGGQPVVGKEEKETWADGHETWVSTTKIPLRGKDGKIAGIIGTSRDITAHKRAQRQVTEYAREIVRRNAQMEEDLVMAREVQQAFLPTRYPTVPRSAPVEQSAVRFSHRYLPAETLGGDFFEIIPLSDTRVGVFICDVMGHGMRAALVTAVIRGLVQELRAFAEDPGQLLTKINLGLMANLKATSATIFASAFYLTLDANSGMICCANAGHPRPFWIRRRRGIVERLPLDKSHRGPVLGLMSDCQFPNIEIEAAVQDCVMMFTDGLYEVDGRNGQPLGEKELIDVVTKQIELPCARLMDGMIALAHHHSSSGVFTDDVCIVGVELARQLKGEDRLKPMPDSRSN